MDKTSEVYKVLKTYGTQVINEMKTRLVNLGKVASGSLLKSLKATVEQTEDGSALLDLQYGATQNLANTSATRINSLGGQTIYTSSGTLTSTQNWNVSAQLGESGKFLIMF